MIAPAMPIDLLAKSPRGALRVTLQRHSFETEEAALRLFSTSGRWGRSWARFFRIEPSDTERMLLNLRVAGLFHDIGKANADFDAMVRGKAVAQCLRHEHLSALVLHLPSVRAWLRQSSALDLEVITAAVLSHHIKASEGGERRWCQPQGKTSVVHYLQHPEVTAILEKVAALAGLPGTPEITKKPWGEAPPWSEAHRQGVQAAREFRRALRDGTGQRHGRRSLLLAVKAGLICADSASSGLTREGLGLEWINDAQGEAIGPDEIRTKLIDRRIAQWEKKSGKAFTFHAFQEGAARLGPRALLLAACGAGKTLAAWRWAESMARQREIGRVVFLYPTRGTATEGFRDYVAWAPEGDASLLHGTARYTLDRIQENPAERADGKADHGLTEAQERLYSLAYWPRRFFSATVDQFLGFMEHGYGGLCLLPVLADAAVIIDEVHSFDRQLFSNLVAFLRAFDVPVLCMTATLPPERRRQLRELGLAVYPGDEDRPQLADLEHEETAPRYRVREITGRGEARDRALAAYREGLRVLWVVNTVARCQDLADELSGALAETVLSYHSRFRLCDRERVHAATVSAFQQVDRRAIAVTTQVCEMSLDLDADVLITEIAPVSAVVQRMGRSNRHRRRGPDFRAEVLVYRPEKNLPYERAEIEAAERFLRDLGDGDVSQRRLAELLESHSPPERDADEFAHFLDGGYYATPASLRDIREFTESCMLLGDLPAVKAALDLREPTDAWVVEVPKKEVLPESQQPAWLPKWLKVADTSRYDPARGYRAVSTEATKAGTR